MILELVPFAMQGVLMGVDEFYCHQRRPLKRWERVGHPLDTLSYIFCLGFLLLVPPSVSALWVFGGLAAFSSLLITKDEWQHKELCDGFENWLHALLFVLHPVVLIWAGYLWWGGSVHFFSVVLSTAVLAFGFLLYQIFYWNVWRHDQQ